MTQIGIVYGQALYTLSLEEDLVEKIRRELTEINGIPVTGTKDEIKVNVVSADDKVTLQSSFITDILNQVNER